jgi:predicted ferric reductase
MYIDGPYGEFTQDIDGTYPTVCIAGGIGVTPFIQLLKVSQDKDISLIFLNKHRSDVIYKETIEQYSRNHLHVLSRETDNAD